MKITLSWLKTHLDIDATPQQIADRLTALGLEVESVEERGLKGFVIGHVIKAEQHPNADRLRVCMVDIGKGEPVQVVCGAPNARAGMKSVFAAPGTHIPGTGIDLKEGAIRGVASKGMLCSARELGLGEDHDGIMDLPQDAPLGEGFAKWRQLEDVSFDINVTPDRADCLSVRGIARDLAASGIGKLKNLPLSPLAGKFAPPLQWEIATPGCIAVAGRYFRNVRNGESPQWLKDRLLSIGHRSISPLVDITNFLTFDLGRPLHVFDADKVEAGKITMRYAQNGEKLKALDEKEYNLTSDMVVIADHRQALAIGGVMGGLESGVSADTKNVFLEVALFDPAHIARTGRQLNLLSDARYRFERGIDPQSLEWGMDRATQLILEICGGEASEVTMAGSIPSNNKIIHYRPNRLKALGGIDLPEDQQSTYLKALGFKIDQKADHWDITIPSWRNDIDGEADMVEEILRLEGYDSILPISLPRQNAMPPLAVTPGQRRVQAAKRLLAGRGLMETVTFSFMESGLAREFVGPDKPLVSLANPISSDLDVMRPSILGNLMQAVSKNASRGLRDLGLFEIGPIYEGEMENEQRLVASGIRAGNALPRHWQGQVREIDFFDAKADAFALLSAFGMPVDNLQILPEAPAYYHPGRSAAFRLGKDILGYCGEIHPRLLRKLGIESTLAGFEIFMERIALPRKTESARPLLKASPFQMVERDFAFIVSKEQRADQLLKAARSADKELIKQVRLFDLYQGKNLPEGKKSLAIAVTLQAPDRTLTDQEIENISGRIVAAVAKATGAELRQ